MGKFEARFLSWPITSCLPVTRDQSVASANGAFKLHGTWSRRSFSNMPGVPKALALLFLYGGGFALQLKCSASKEAG